MLSRLLGWRYDGSGRALGMPFMGMATDPNTGPLPALPAFAFWPAGRLQDSPATVIVPQGAAA